MHCNSKILAATLIAALALTSSAQQVAPLSPREAAIKQKADHLALNAPISVIRFHAEEEFGKFLSNDQESITFYDIDDKADVTLKYADVKKIKNGYGGYNWMRGRHTDRTKGLIVAAVVVGALALLIGAAATAKD